MNILILNWRDIRHPKSGGAERVTMEHAKAWVARGHTVDWLTAGYKNGTSEEDVDGVRIVRKGGSFTVYLFAFWYLSWQSRRYDVIVDEFHGLPFFSPLLGKTPVVGFIHEVAGEIWDYMFPFPISAIGKIVERLSFLIYRNVPFWTDAPSMAEELTRYGIPPQNIHVIPCPIPGEVPSPVVSKEKDPTFLFISRIVPMKGIESVISAFSLIHRQIPKAKLWIIGSSHGNYLSRVRNLVQQNNLTSDVSFLGALSEKEKYERMARSHILLHASVKEGWGLVVLEAASQGTPSVVYNVTGLADVVKNGLTGVIVKKNTPEELAVEAIHILRDKKRYVAYQKNGKEWANSFAWDDVTRESLGLLLARGMKKI